MDEQSMTPEEENEDLAPAVGMAQDTMDKFLDTASVDAVFGIPVQHEDTLIIPAAEILSGMAFGVGFGSGTGPVEAKEGEENQTPAMGSGSGGGGGGGGRVLARPVAVVIASPQGVRVEPVVDVTKIALAALTAVGFMIGMTVRMLNPKRAFPNGEE